MTRALLLLACLGALVLAAPAPAATRYEIVDDCADDSRLQGDYTVAELRDARQNLTSEAAEYTDCYDVLRRAELRRLAAAAAPAGGGAVEPQPPGESAQPLVPADDRERAQLAEARAAGATAVVRDGHAIVPGSAGFAARAVRNEMPVSLGGAVLALVLLGAGGAAFAAGRRFTTRGDGEAMENDPWRPIP